MNIQEYNRRFDHVLGQAEHLSDVDLAKHIQVIREDDDRQNERGFLGRIRCGDPEFSALSWVQHVRRKH